MGARGGRNTLAYFCHQVLPIELLSDPILFTLRVLRLPRGMNYPIPLGCPSWFYLLSVAIRESPKATCVPQISSASVCG